MVDPIERLRAVNPERDCPRPSLDEVWRRIEADARPPARRVEPGRGRARRIPRARGAGALMIGMSSLIAVAIVAVAITQLSPRHHEARPGSPGASQLLARIAVLRRPQNASDLLPRNLHFVTGRVGSIIQRLTRRVYVSGGTRMFLVAVKPAADDPLWGPRFGDQVAIVAVAGNQAAEIRPIPAADLSDADEVGIVSPGGGFTSSGPQDAYSVAVVPDGVARVSWRFVAGNQGTVRTADVTARNNAAILPNNTGLLTRAAWYDAQGDVIPTTDAAFVKAIERREASTAAPMIRYFERHPQPRPAVTGDFAIFSVTSARGIRTASGDIISAPPLTELPLPILSLSYHGGRRSGQPDMADVRHVLTPTGVSIYVIPGPFGLCSYNVHTSLLPRVIDGGGGSCTASTELAEEHGSGFSSGGLGRATTTFRLLPKSIRTITIREKNGARRTIQVPYGIYVRVH